MFEGKHTYGDFQRSDEKIASNILADRLEMLEWVGVLTKEGDPANKKVFIYKLTQKGIDLVPVMLELILWSDKYNEISQQAKIFAKQIKTNKEEVTRQITTMMKESILQK